MKKTRPISLLLVLPVLGLLLVSMSPPASAGSLSVTTSSPEVAHGETIHVYFREGEPNATVVVRVYREGLTLIEGPYRIGLDANGSAILTFIPTCTVDEILGSGCKWAPGRYDVTVEDDASHWLNKTRFRVRISDALIWAWFQGGVKSVQEKDAEDDAKEAVVYWTAFGLAALVAAVAVFIAWTEAAGPLNLTQHSLRVVLRGPRWFIRFWLGRTVPRIYNADAFPQLAPKEIASANEQIYNGIGDKHARKAERLEARAKRRREAEGWAREGARIWRTKGKEGPQDG